MASLFDTLFKEFESTGYNSRSKDAKLWWLERVNDLEGNINRRKLLKDEELRRVKSPNIGFMYMYVYDPKTKKQLPYYDKFPLTIMIGPDGKRTGFHGLNLHYLHPIVRAKFLDKLIETYGTTKNLTDRTKILARYKLIKGASKMKEFQPCFKHYLFKHVKTGFSKIDAPDWEIAIFLPTEHFSKANKTRVWSESKRMFS